jgi:WD40 repeat protein
VFSPDGQWIAFRNPSEMVMTWKTAVKRDGIRMQSTHGAGPIAFSPDGRLLATGFGEGMVRLSDAETGRLVAELKGHTDRVRSLAFTPDGSQLLSAAFDGAVLMWNVGPDQLAAKGDTPETASDP